ncbi:hypothetical protein ABW19_dt0200966 [Dactylella cylindrospora]|nr:hypothetical protein ABW19_dt0200966 [Dactylella cylindrospora]
MQGNSKVLRHLLSRGASVHIRNRENHTPLYVAADAGYPENVKLLREAGAHLHPDEVELAQILKQKALRSSAASSLSNSPVGGSSANNTAKGAREDKDGHLVVVVEDEAVKVNGNVNGNGVAVTNGVVDSSEAAECWSLAGV